RGTISGCPAKGTDDGQSFTPSSIRGGYLMMNSGARTSVIVLSSLINTCSEGPAVSLKGSPTVSPTTAAACTGVAFLITEPSSASMLPASTNFLALSQAPPELLKKVASSMPPIVPTISRP